MSRIYQIGVICFVFIMFSSLGIVNALETVDLELNSTKINNAFSCLENKTVGKASSASFEEIAFVILASPKSSVLSEYKSELISRKQVISENQECWPKTNCKIKDTALALLALNHLGENTQKVENWLLSKNRTATDIIWLLQEDSEAETKCTITYDQTDYDTTILSDKKISTAAGNCLPIYQNRFWFQVAQNCYDKEFILSCDRNFIANFLYKKSNGGSVIYVDSNTQSSPALGEISLKINSKCFGLSSCDYEGSLWATFALLRKGHDVKSFVPYLIALSDSNKAYFPESFLYIITGFEDYGNWLIQNQDLGNFWQADGSPNGKFYDTALALIALSNSNAEQVANARKRMERYQDNNGCWVSPKTVRDTAILLWALAGRAPSIEVVPSITYCEEAGFFCMEQVECGVSDRLGQNYFCSGGRECCRVENLQTCSERGGRRCPSDKDCSGVTVTTSDETECCLLSCVEPVSTSECENNNNFCFTSCSSSQEAVAQDCNGGLTCCKFISNNEEKSAGNWWIWLIILGIIILIAIIAYLQREKIKLWWFKRSNNVKGGPVFPSGGFRPGPPFVGGPGLQRPIVGRPILRRPVFTPARPVIPTGQNPQQENRVLNSEDDETFKKLREMSK